MSIACLMHPDGVCGTGSEDAEIMFVGIAPGRDEWLRTKQPFTGPSGKLLNGLLSIVNIDRASVYTTNLICWWNDSPSDEDIHACAQRFNDEVRAIRPKIIVCLGKIVTEYMMKRPFGKVRGGAFWSDEYDCWMISTNHPAAYTYADSKVEIHDGVRDFRKFEIYLKAPRDFGNVEVQVPETLEDCNKILQHFVDVEHTEKVAAIDVETYYRSGTGMQSIAFSCEHGTFHFPRHLVYGPDYSILLQATQMIWAFHNGQFDTQKIHKHLLVKLLIGEDSMYQSYSLDERAGGDTEADAGGDERAVGIHGLKRLSMEYCGAETYSDDIKSKDYHIEDMTPAELAHYNGCDAAYTYRLVLYFRPLQIADNVRDMYLNILIPAANVLRDINARGAYIDSEAVRELALEWLPRWLSTEEEILKMARDFGWVAELDINTNSPKQISHFIYDICGAPTIGTGKMVRSTAKPIVEQMVKEYPEHIASLWLTKLLEWRGLDRDINTYIKSVEELKDENGFIHPEALLHGTRNGRLAYHNPPVQTIPKARTVGADRARIRRIFAAAPPSDRGTGERELMEADMRQAELWWGAFISHDAQMLEDLHSGDFHARNVEANWGITKETSDPIAWDYARDSAKRLVYLIQYGGGPEGAVATKKLSGVGGANYMFLATIEDARRAFKNYFDRYSGFTDWRKKEQAIVMKEGEQVSWTGRKRRYYMITNYKQLNQAINTPVSSLSHDALLNSVMELHWALESLDAYILFEVHDSIVIDYPKQNREDVAALVEQIMTKPKFGAPEGVPIDIKIGKNWHDMFDIEKVRKQESLVA